MNKDEAKTIVLKNLKGPKQKPSPLMIVAEAVRLLLKEKEYSTTASLAKDVGASRTIIESFDKMNDQPDEIKQLIQEGKIRIDASTKLSSIIDEQRRINIAKTVAGLSANDTRKIISYCKKHSKLSAEDCKIETLRLKPTKQQSKSVTISLGLTEHQKFLETSRKAGLTPKEAGKKAITKWIQSQTKTTNS